MKKTIFIILSICIILTATHYAVSGSILSSHGLGLHFHHPNVRSQGMGNLSIANLSPYEIPRINPAALFINTGTRFSVYYYFENNNYRDSENGSAQSQYSNFDGFNLIIPLGSGFGLAIGLNPLTRMDYKFSFQESLEKNPYTKSVQGDGGLNSFDFSFYWSIKTYFSLGLKGEYIFGTLNESWRVIYDDKETFFPSSDYFTTKNSGFNYTAGLIIRPLSSLTLGAIFSPKVNLSNTTEISYIFSDSTDKFDGSITYPGFWGIGISYIYKTKGMIGFDYLVRDWESMLINGNRPDNIRNPEKLSFGCEIYRSRKIQTSFFKKINYRFGYCSKPHFSLDPEGNTISEHWFSLGFGFPLKSLLSEVNLSLAFGKRGSIVENGISENLFRIGVAITAGEKWFLRRY